MTTLDFYNRYRTLSLRRAVLEGTLRSGEPSEYEALVAELDDVTQRMDRIEHELSLYIPYDLPPRLHYKALEEREFLYFRCIKGLTLSQTAELLNVSRDTVYRIRRRLALAQGPAFAPAEQY